MAIKFPVSPGTIVMCNYDTGFRPPEMVKRRPVIVVSPRLKKCDGLCTVVPLSTTPPPPDIPYVCDIVLREPLSEKFSSTSLWVKADMLGTVAFSRLDLIQTARDRGTGRRRYKMVKISSEDMNRIRRCILCALGMNVEKIDIDARF